MLSFAIYIIYAPVSTRMQLMSKNGKINLRRSYLTCIRFPPRLQGPFHIRIYRSIDIYLCWMDPHCRFLCKDVFLYGNIYFLNVPCLAYCCILLLWFIQHVNTSYRLYFIQIILLNVIFCLCRHIPRFFIQTYIWYYFASDIFAL